MFAYSIEHKHVKILIRQRFFTGNSEKDKKKLVKCFRSRFFFKRSSGMFYQIKKHTQQHPIKS